VRSLSPSVSTKVLWIASSNDFIAIEFNNPNGNGNYRYLARFVTDLTAPDGSNFLTNQSFVKVWKVRNEGNTAWPEDTHLVFVGGDLLSNIQSVAVPSIKPGEEIDIAVDMITPSKPGRYISYWRLSQADGSRFGQRMWADVVVASDNSKSAQKPTSTNANQVPITQSSSSSTMEVETQTQLPSQSQNQTQTQSIPLSQAQTQTSQPMVIEVQTETDPVQKIDLSVQKLSLDDTNKEKVNQIKDMGFNFSDEVISDLLARFNGDVIKTVQELLNH